MRCEQSGISQSRRRELRYFNPAAAVRVRVHHCGAAAKKNGNTFVKL